MGREQLSNVTKVPKKHQWGHFYVMGKGRLMNKKGFIEDDEMRNNERKMIPLSNLKGYQKFYLEEITKMSTH